MRQRLRAHARCGPWGMLMLAAVACGRGALAGGVGDSTFVATMADLERIGRDAAMDSAGRTAARAKALQGRGLTRAQLEAAAASLAADPARALRVYRAIETRASDAPPAVRDSAAAAPRR